MRPDLKEPSRPASTSHRRGGNVFLVELPRPDGVEKIDLNEYLKDHTADDLRKLMSEAKSVVDILIRRPARRLCQSPTDAEIGDSAPSGRDE